jgi:hypothetical protein
MQVKFLISKMRNPFLFCLICLVLAGLQAKAQVNESASPVEKGFKREKSFVGGGINLGFSGRSFAIGLNPEYGYSINHWLDLGAVANLSYFSENARDINNTTNKYFHWGGGGFLRAWPLPFLNFQVQPEYNFIQSTFRDFGANQTIQQRYSTPSVLVGIGYGNRTLGQRYSYFSLMIDILQDPLSPYRDQFGNAQPILRAGFGMYLRPSKR